MSDEAQKNGVSVTELKELFPGYQGALQGIVNEQKQAAAVGRPSVTVGRAVGAEP